MYEWIGIQIVYAKDDGVFTNNYSCQSVIMVADILVYPLVDSEFNIVWGTIMDYLY